ncbi:MAG: hypothetical protein KGJ59_01775 [Bacteroidota bacterium]|nr:hypothetical protein [Bacteroidota bacterium]
MIHNGSEKSDASSLSRVRRDRSFPRSVLSVFIGIAVLSSYPLYRYASAGVIRASVIGGLLSLANVLAGYAAIEYSIGKSYTTFLKVVLGGMGARLFAMLGALLILIEVFHVHPVALVVSLVGLYLIFLVLEIFFIQRKLTSRQ